SPRTPDLTAHRELRRFIEDQLDRLDFQDKTVLDIGCWDGYWSFYAERRGARLVLATDDKSQNWAGSDGLMLARGLLDSKMEPHLDCLDLRSISVRSVRYYSVPRPLVSSGRPIL